MGGGGVAHALAQQPKDDVRASHVLNCSLATVAVATDNPTGGAPSPDIWDDSLALHFLQRHARAPDTPAHERKRAERRAAAYEWSNGLLRRRMADGSTRVVPPPADRADVVRQVHNQCGHFGEKRTVSLLQTGHWWRGLTDTVHEVVRRCPLCDRVNKSFNITTPELHSLPIMGPGYRWSADLAGPLPTTLRTRSQYVCVFMEHFSKYVELVPLPNKESVHTRAALLYAVIGRHGAHAEHLTDMGTEWQGA